MSLPRLQARLFTRGCCPAAPCLPPVARAPAREKDVSVVEPDKAVSLRPSRRELEAGKEEALLEELGAVGHFIPFISASGHEKNVLPEMASGCDSVGPCMSEMRLNLG